MAAAEQAVASGDESKLPNLLLLAAVSILRLQGAADALKIKQAMPTAITRKLSDPRKKGTKTRKEAETFLTSFQQRRPKATRAVAVQALARHLEITPTHARRLMNSERRTFST